MRSVKRARLRCVRPNGASRSCRPLWERTSGRVRPSARARWALSRHAMQEYVPEAERGCADRMRLGSYLGQRFQHGSYVEYVTQASAKHKLVYQSARRQTARPSGQR